MSKTDKLCILAKEGKLKKIVKLSKKPEYICKKCARVAHFEDNLCNPREFDE